MLRSLLLAAAAALSLSACATETTTVDNAPAADRDCVNVNSINGFNAVDDSHIKVSTGPSRAYILTTTTRINDINFHERLGVQTTNNWLCTGNGLGVRLLVPGSIPDTYYVNEVVRAPEEAPPAQEAPPQGS